MSKTKASKPVLVEHWAICQFYEPFVMGGSVWQFRRFKVQAEDIKLVSGFKGFLYRDQVSKVWRVYEESTGGMLGEGRTREEAIYQANYNIKRTPDLRKQVETLGDPMRHEEADTAEALRRLAKSKK